VCFIGCISSCDGKIDRLSYLLLSDYDFLNLHSHWLFKLSRVDGFFEKVLLSHVCATSIFFLSISFKIAINFISFNRILIKISMFIIFWLIMHFFYFSLSTLRYYEKECIMNLSNNMNVFELLHNSI
jgi:hypothetical protein